MIKTQGNDFVFNYIIYSPEQNNGELPLIIYLHGAGERGKNTDHLLRHGIPRVIEEGREIDAVVLCPQCPAPYVWNNMVKELKVLIDEVVERYSIKKDRIAITGSSMGGFGTWEMGLTYSNFFSMIAPVCGGGMSWRTANLRNTAIVAYHGDCDNSVTPANTEMMVEGVRKHGGEAELIIMHGFGHNDGIHEVYSNTDIIDRLVRARRTDFTPVPECLSDMF